MPSIGQHCGPQPRPRRALWPCAPSMRPPPAAAATPGDAGLALKGPFAAAAPAAQDRPAPGRRPHLIVRPPKDPPRAMARGARGAGPAPPGPRAVPLWGMGQGPGHGMAQAPSHGGS